jgi:hypothetical protein
MQSVFCSGILQVCSDVNLTVSSHALYLSAKLGKLGSVPCMKLTLQDMVSSCAICVGSLGTSRYDCTLL